MAPRFWLMRSWRWPLSMLVLFGIETSLTVAALALFGIADPDTYRTKLWKDGALNGFNSDPEELLLAYANHVRPDIPLVWRQFTTTWNLVISVVSLFILLVKVSAFVMRRLYPLVSLVIHLGLTAVFAFSMYAQLSSDTLDRYHPQNGPAWYITKSCDVAHDPRNIGYCKQAKASLAVTVAMVVMFLLLSVLSLVSIYPTRIERFLHHQQQDDKPDPAEMQDIEKHFPSTPPAAQKWTRKHAPPALELSSLSTRLSPIPPAMLSTSPAGRRFATTSAHTSAVYIPHSPPEYTPSPRASTGHNQRQSHVQFHTGPLPSFDPPPRTAIKTPRTLAFDTLTGRARSSPRTEGRARTPASLREMSETVGRVGAAMGLPRLLGLVRGHGQRESAKGWKARRKERKEVQETERRRKIERLVALQGGRSGGSNVIEETGHGSSQRGQDGQILHSASSALGRLPFREAYGASS